ncbi:ATP synthase F1 subunit epsilon [[Clostridium] polysaccharolyticum]|uniref:ATP synthase epsilon chain n=1 Tax=[Clostridium] polysaccharolyticum TaxID=29364 RepID=A0A1I0BRN2_9FIRM|nr:ATP synthase F1 subunit epsilon [[Clostridium] polysaccharolyticum]SET09563.1 ATP synthase F1 subcomplex epsilon subunit [[Clostridium] polysaccharolyticum]
MADNKYFKVKVISPDRIFFEGEADFLELKTSEGDIGILAGHIPLTAVIAPGIMKITKDSEVKEASLLEGFVEILPDRVTVLAEACEWPDEIDVNRANEAKIRAERRLAGGEGDINYPRAEMALRKALIRIELGDRRGL